MSAFHASQQTTANVRCYRKIPNTRKQITDASFGQHATLILEKDLVIALPLRLR